MEDVDKHFKSIYKRNTYISLSYENQYDVKLIVNTNKDECYRIVRDTLANTVNGSCVYGVEGNEIYFTVSNHDVCAIDKVLKALNKKKNIVIESISVNPYKIKHYMK